MSLTYQLTLSREAIKFLKKQETSVVLRISIALKGLLIQPPIGDIKPLKGKKGQLRLRTGPFRTI
ncbi:type II toxin-antitoxin system RelE/ParE family toxin [Bacillus sp. P14.5]|uniref:type II toxin-antitoxin system RelE family toxin n=1 Tax=Bacillus sp. P14.5 TaxID=1983400 RepID=UPI0031F584B0